MGKAYANRKPVEKRPDSDYYSTPVSLVWKLLELKEFETNHLVYEPATGDAHAIARTLTTHNFNVIEDDIRLTGKDFLQNTTKYKYIITNPPFSLFDDFVISAKKSSDKFAFIFKTNFFGAYKRWESGIWDNLKSIHIFNRQVDYRTPYREDGLFNVGNLVTGWAIWDSTYDKKDFKSSILDVQDYAKLGGFKE